MVGRDGNAYIEYDCSTQPGSSGSPVIDLETGKVYGLHFAGAYKIANFGWPMWRVCQIPEVREILDLD